MARIICDVYMKENKQIWGDNPAETFNQKILAVNNMYGWLYDQGILRAESFKFKDYSDMSYFAIDTKDLLAYREQMEQAGVDGAALAVTHIFDEEYTPCLYSGAIQLGWTMKTYRDFDGTVGSSWECGVVQGLQSHAVLDIEQIKNEKGARAAISEAFDLYGLEPDLFDMACEYFRDWIDVADNDNREFLNLHADKLIYCYEHKKDMLDFDFWVQYENLLDEKITWDEYVAIDNTLDGDPHDIEMNDSEAIAGFKASLNEFRATRSPSEHSPEKPSETIVITKEDMDSMSRSAEARLRTDAKKEFQSLTDKIQIAETKHTGNSAPSNSPTKEPEPRR